MGDLRTSPGRLAVVRAGVPVHSDGEDVVGGPGGGGSDRVFLPTGAAGDRASGGHGADDERRLVNDAAAGICRAS